MKRILILLGGSIILFSSCNKETIRGEGAISTETRPLPVFTNVELGGSGEATINYGVAYNVTLTGYQNLLLIYETRVEGNTLYLQFKSNVYNVKNNNIKATVT